MSYVELHARSAFSFLRGASQPEWLASEAARLGMPALALCDRGGVYGAPRLHAAAKELGIRAIAGAELPMEDGCVLPVLVASRSGYRNLCRLITVAKLRGTKTEAPVKWSELPGQTEGLIALTGDEEGVFRDPKNAGTMLDRLVDSFGRDNVYLEIQRHFLREEEWRNQCIVDAARARNLPLVATNGVCCHEAAARGVLDVLACIRHHTDLDHAGRLLAPNAERHLKSAATMRRIFADLPDAVDNTLRIAERIDFSLSNLGYEFPRYPVPDGETMDSWLRKMTYAGARTRYGVPSARVTAQLDRELDLIGKLGFPGYFLIVWDIVNFCREQDILVQGRGSAANSAVCYSLGITACDPIACNLLFERFLSEGRTSWPDIDLDLPSGDRRERVIQEVYRRYGSHGAAMTANVITYRGRSAMREIGKALGFSRDVVDRFSSLYANGDFPHTLDLKSQLRQAGIPGDHSRADVAARLYERMYGLPRHLGQHSGGMIICQGELSSVVPLENASMPGRVVAQWDKDDCEDLGIIKVDLLGLGMMAAMQDALELCARRNRPVDLATIPKDDPATYDLMCAADTIGTFQVESRAQMATLPRMRPRCFYDVVVEVAIIRPGPIQGDMVHPYLNRREGFEEVTYFDERLRPVLERTLGVPLFQEQFLKIAMIMADFTGAEAEELRRALSFHRSQERMEKVCKKLRAGMERNGTPTAVIDQLTRALQGFALYGFPESHAISFALIAYTSCWMKVHRPQEFYVGLLNNMPMGFYSPFTLIRDARVRGVKVRAPSVLHSDYDSTIEADEAIRLGLRIVRGLDAETGLRIQEERRQAAFESLDDFRLRIAPRKDVLRTLAKAGALNGLAAHRREGLWNIELPQRTTDALNLDANDGPMPLAPMNPIERMQADFESTGVTTGRHPMGIIRAELPDIIRAADLAGLENGVRATIAGMVICRQRPGTAKGFVFVSLEDETGISNAIVDPKLFEQRRLVITQEAFLSITGIVQNARNTILIRAESIEALPYESLAAPASHDFR
jgi:error-prone DNA polymerase